MSGVRGDDVLGGVPFSVSNPAFSPSTAALPPAEVEEVDATDLEPAPEEEPREEPKAPRKRPARKPKTA